MRKPTTQLLFVNAFALLALALGVQPAQASDTPVDDVSGFGSSVGSFSTTLTTGKWQANLSETVYQNGGVYTYVFTLANSTTSTVGLAFASTTTLPANDLFDQTANWGVVTDITGTTSTCIVDCTNSNNVDVSSFNFGGSSFQANFTSNSLDLPAGDQITFYAQGGPPAPGSFGAQDGTQNTNSTGPLDPVPEPTSILLFGTGLLVLGVLLRRRLPQLPQPL